MSGRWFILTIPQADISLLDTLYELPQEIIYMKGQKELGEGGYKHWQLVVCMRVNSRIPAVKRHFCNSAHVELTRSASALAYVWKEETRVPNSQFEYGSLPVKRNSATDWDKVWDSAKKGNFADIPPQILVRSYSSIKSIAKDHMKPEAMERTVKVYWGLTGTGKSRRAWQEASLDAFPKDPMTKFWDGYQNQENVVIDEYRGDISISHLLRWFDRYPVCVEAKHGGVVLKAKRIWITSNLHPDNWYPTLDRETVDALKRRLEITKIE